MYKQGWEIIEEKQKVLEDCQEKMITLMEFSITKREAWHLAVWGASLDKPYDGLVNLTEVEKRYQDLLKNNGKALLMGIPVKVREQLNV